MRKLLLTLCAAACLPAWADGLQSLEAFIRETRSGRADFTQVVTAPSREGHTGRSKTSTGSFEFVRPNRFRFDYRKPFEQVIVADGQTLWLYDADLNQVSARPQAAVLGSTPAALIASAPDLNALRGLFELSADGEKEGVQWVKAVPRQKDGQLASMRVGLRGNELAVLEILDGFGQRSVITFSRMALNANVAATQFQFKPPAGATVTRQ